MGKGSRRRRFLRGAVLGRAVDLLRTGGVFLYFQCFEVFPVGHREKQGHCFRQAAQVWGYPGESLKGLLLGDNGEISPYPLEAKSRSPTAPTPVGIFSSGVLKSVLLPHQSRKPILLRVKVPLRSRLT